MHGDGDADGSITGMCGARHRLRRVMRRPGRKGEIGMSKEMMVNSLIFQSFYDIYFLLYSVSFLEYR